MGKRSLSILSMGARSCSRLATEIRKVSTSPDQVTYGQRNMVLRGRRTQSIATGANYGWPYMTDGTDYGSFSWPLNRPRAEQRDYQEPVFSWVPSIAVSNLIGVERRLFPEWQGDLLIATLKARTLFRAHLSGSRVAYIEPIYIGSGIRDLIEGHDGRIILWTDSIL